MIVEPPPLAEILAARDRIGDGVIRSPLIRLGDGDRGAAVWLKLESLQPIGSFKLRGALSAMRRATRETLERGVVTASAGNMAQGVAWGARALGVPCTVIVPEHAPRAKLDPVERWGATIVRVAYEEWWRVMVERTFPGMTGLFIHPVSDPAVIAGNGTIGLEILEDRPDVDAILVPYGGGGLSCGIAAAVRALRPEIRVVACEVETAAPLAASLAAGSPQTIAPVPSFVDGIGGRGVLSEMWPLARALLAGSRVVSLRAVADAIRLLAERNRVIAEGAGAASVAAACSGDPEGRTVVCVVSGGNIDTEVLARILRGEIPAPQA